MNFTRIQGPFSGMTELPPNRGGVRPGNRTAYKRVRHVRKAEEPRLRHTPQGPPPTGTAAERRHAARLRSLNLL